MSDYDEFGLLHENAKEVGLAFSSSPVVERRFVEVGRGQRISALIWGDAPAEIVLIHGGAQNAHTWDTVALALDRPLVALDLPGHGHSDWRDDQDYSPSRNAEAVSVALPQLAPSARLVVGMSLGGLTSCVLGSRHPELTPKIALVDVTPGVDREKSTAITNFIRGPEHFDSFEQILQRTLEHNPTRSESSLRRGVIHNAKQLPDGRWTWRYDRSFRSRGNTTAEGTAAHAATPEPVTIDFRALWDHVSNIRAPLMLARGNLSPVVDDADVEELRKRQPKVRVAVVEGAGHSIQGDRPLELARLLEDFLEG